MLLYITAALIQFSKPSFPWACWLLCKLTQFIFVNEWFYYAIMVMSYVARCLKDNWYKNISFRTVCVARESRLTVGCRAVCDQSAVVHFCSPLQPAITTNDLITDSPCYEQTISVQRLLPFFWPRACLKPHVQQFSQELQSHFALSRHTWL